MFRPFGTFFTRLTVKYWFKYKPSYANEINSGMNYHYFQVWKHLIKTSRAPKTRVLYGYKPSCPVVYIFALGKPFQFHNQKWLDYIEGTKNCEKHAVKGGHWIMIKHLDFMVKTIKRRISNINNINNL